MTVVSQIIVKANTNQAIQAYNQLSGAQQKTAQSTDKLGDSAKRSRITQMNLNRVIQDAPFGFIAIQNNIDPLLQSFSALRAETGSTKLAFKALLSSFAGPAGLIGIVGLAVSAFTTYLMLNRKTKKSTKELKQETAGLSKEVRMLESAYNNIVKIQNLTPGGSIRINAKDLQDAIKASDNLLESMSMAASITAAQFPDTGELNKYYNSLKDIAKKSAPNLDVRQRMLANLEKERLKAVQALQNEYNDNLATMGEHIGAQKVINEQLKEQYKQYQANKAVLQEILRLRLQARDTTISNLEFKSVQLLADPKVTDEREKARERNKAIVEGTYKPKGVQFNSEEIDTSGYKKQMQEYLKAGTDGAIQFGQVFKNSLTSAGMQAFDTMFGHANSLIGVFLQSLASGMFSILMSKLSGSILDFLIPGLGGATSSPITAGGGNVYLDGEKIADRVSQINNRKSRSSRE